MNLQQKYNYFLSELLQSCTTDLDIDHFDWSKNTTFVTLTPTTNLHFTLYEGMIIMGIELVGVRRTIELVGSVFASLGDGEDLPEDFGVSETVAGNVTFISCVKLEGGSTLEDIKNNLDKLRLTADNILPIINRHLLSL